MSDRLFALTVFARVARTGSFSAAGRELGVPQSTVSRMVAQLEKGVGAQLLVRTTRLVTLSDAGEDYLARIEPILAAIEEADHVVRGTGELRGILRVGLGSSFAIRKVIPFLPGFMAKHPALTVDLMMDDARQDLVLEGVDVAFRFGTLNDSTATSRRIATWPRVLVASPAYLIAAGMPHSPSALPAHSLILGPAGGTRWSFRRDGTASSVQVEGRLRISGAEGAMAAAVAGLGIVMAPLDACSREIDDGVLTRVLPQWDAGSVQLHAVYASGKAAKPSARAFADALSDSLAR